MVCHYCGYQTQAAEEMPFLRIGLYRSFPGGHPAGGGSGREGISGSEDSADGFRYHEAEGRP